MHLISITLWQYVVQTCAQGNFNLAKFNYNFNQDTCIYIQLRFGTSVEGWAYPKYVLSSKDIVDNVRTEIKKKAYYCT